MKPASRGFLRLWRWRMIAARHICKPYWCEPGSAAKMKNTNPVEAAIAEAKRIAKKRDSSKSIEEREHYQRLVDAAVQDIIQLQNYRP